MPILLALVLTLAQAAAAPLTVEERLLFAIPDQLSFASIHAVFASSGDRAVCVLGREDGLSQYYGLGFGEAALGASAPHRFVAVPAFAPDGSLAWAWGDEADRDAQTWELWQDGKKLKSWDWIGALAFSSAGELAYQAGEDVRLTADLWDERGDFYMIRGKKKSAKYRFSWMGAPAWSPDGKRLAFVAAKPNGSVVVVDGKESDAFQWVQGLRWSADSKEVVFAATDDEGRSRIVRGKKEYGLEREAVGAPATGGGALAYLYASKGRRGVVFRDEALPGLYDALGTPAVSADGMRIAVAAARDLGRADNGWVFVDPSWMDGTMTAEEAAAAVAAPDAAPAATPDDAPQAAASRGPKCFLVVDGRPRPGEWLRVMRPSFSPDGARLAARVRDCEGWHLLLDERVTGAYEQISEPRFAADGALLFGARRGRELLAVRIPAQP